MNVLDLWVPFDQRDPVVASALYYVVEVEGPDDDAVLLDLPVDMCWRTLYEGYR